MKLKKMLLLAGMALAAVAFAAPAVAQATVQLTENGKALKAGALVTTTSTNLVTTTTPGNNKLACKKVTLHYKVTTNGPTHVVLEPVIPVGATDNGTTEECHLVTPSGMTFVANITNAGTGEVTINTWGTAETAATFTVAVPALALHCSYTGTVHLQGTASGTSGVTVGSSPLTAPGCEEGDIAGNASLETPNGTAVTLDYVQT
jgi:hypothetical protein